MVMAAVAENIMERCCAKIVSTVLMFNDVRTDAADETKKLVAYGKCHYLKVLCKR